MPSHSPAPHDSLSLYIYILGYGAARYQTLTSTSFLSQTRSQSHRRRAKQAVDPYRENFTTIDSWEHGHPEFEPKLCFYVFTAAVEHVKARILPPARCVTGSWKSVLETAEITPRFYRTCGDTVYEQNTNISSDVKRKPMTDFQCLLPQVSFLRSLNVV